MIGEEDQYDNLETSDNSTVVTAYLGSGVGPLQGTVTATVAGGIATFSNLDDDTAETITLQFTGGGLTSAASVPIVVSPAAASKLVIQTEPSATATAGVPFATQPVIEEGTSTATWKQATPARWSRFAGQRHGTAPGHDDPRSPTAWPHSPASPTTGRDDHTQVLQRHPDCGDLDSSILRRDTSTPRHSQRPTPTPTPTPHSRRPTPWTYRAEAKVHNVNSATTTPTDATFDPTYNQPRQRA